MRINNLYFYHMHAKGIETFSTRGMHKFFPEDFDMNLERILPVVYTASLTQLSKNFNSGINYFDFTKMTPITTSKSLLDLNLQIGIDPRTLYNVDTNDAMLYVDFFLHFSPTSGTSPYNVRIFVQCYNQTNALQYSIQTDVNHFYSDSGGYTAVPLRASAPVFLPSGSYLKIQVNISGDGGGKTYSQYTGSLILSHVYDYDIIV